MDSKLTMGQLNNQKSRIKFPLPIISSNFSSCEQCRFCCQWCKYISDDGCKAPKSYELLELCKAFPVLIGNSESRNASLGIWEDQFPPAFGAFVPLGSRCAATLDEQQRSIFQTAARWINDGKRSFQIYEQFNSYNIFIKVVDPLNIVKIKKKSNKTFKILPVV